MPAATFLLTTEAARFAATSSRESGKSMTIDGGLRKEFRRRIRDVHWQTIERLLDRGVPDSNVCCDGVDTWIEYKFTRKWYVKIRPEQIGWHLTRARHGGRSVIAVRQTIAPGPRRGDAVDALWLIQGSAAAVLAEHGLQPYHRVLSGGARWPRDVLGRWYGGPGVWPWQDVRAVLAGRRA